MMQVECRQSSTRCALREGTLQRFSENLVKLLTFNGVHGYKQMLVVDKRSTKRQRRFTAFMLDIQQQGIVSRL